MNDELQNALLDIINKTVDATGTATGFIVEQTPDVIRQLLVWKMAESLFLALSCLAAFAVYIKFIYMVKNAKPSERGASNWAYDFSGDMQIGIYMTLASGSIPALCFLVAFFSWILVFIQIWLAPKVYLLEYASKLIN